MSLAGLEQCTQIVVDGIGAGVVLIMSSPGRSGESSAENPNFLTFDDYVE